MRCFPLLVFALPFAFSISCTSLPSKPTETQIEVSDLNAWVIEQRSGGDVTTRGDALVINDAAGCTLWLRQALTAPVDISYEVTVVSRGGPNDRVSDVNCFWMASDSSGGQPFAIPPTKAFRSGTFEEYDSLRTYYVGMGGNENTTTRFRRYAGNGEKPLLPEHDLRDRRVLLEADRTYRIRLVARNGVAEFWRDGEKLLSFKDPQPLTQGWFALRTVKSHLEIRNLRLSSR